MSSLTRPVVTREVKIQQREVSTKAGRALTAGNSYHPERNYGITKRTWINAHASAWETTEGYGDKRNYVCALKKWGVLPLCCREGETLLQDQGKTFVDLHWKCFGLCTALRELKKEDVTNHCAVVREKSTEAASELCGGCTVSCK